MYRRKLILFTSILLIFALSACNLPTNSPEESPTPDLALTVTALAGGGAQPQETATPGAPAGSAETATPQFTATAFTATPSVPQVSVSTNTNCRTGPGVIYDQIDALLIGQTAEVVGKNSSVPNYWVIKRINGSGTCWLWGEYATVSGNTANLPEYPVPPTPTPTITPTATFTPTPVAPAAVNNPVMNMICIPVGFNFNHSGVLTWEDKSNNETGFNIYANGSLIGTVPANITVFNVPPFGPFIPGIASIFGVEAYNATGKSPIKTVTRGCP